jgi:hypothetical protein
MKYDHFLGHDNKEKNSWIFQDSSVRLYRLPSRQRSISLLDLTNVPDSPVTILDLLYNLQKKKEKYTPE